MVRLIAWTGEMRMTGNNWECANGQANARVYRPILKRDHSDPCPGSSGV